MKTIKKISIAATVIIAASVMAGCATSDALKTTVIPQANNKYMVVATAQNNETAIKGATQKAESVCAGEGKKLVMLGNQMKHENGASSHDAFDAGDSDRQPEDYMSTVQFECR